MKHFICISILIASFQSIAQNDYLITLQGDSINGNIEFIQGQFYDEVMIRNDEGRENYKIFQVKSAVKDGEKYEMIAYNNKNVVGKIIIKGLLSLYKIREENVYDFNLDYLVRSSGENLPVPNLKFKKALSEYLSDCPDLVAKIENKEFTSINIEELVNFYNSQCSLKEVTNEPSKEQEKNSLAELAQLILDIQSKLDKNETVPGYMLEALKSYTSRDLNEQVMEWIRKLENN